MENIKAIDTIYKNHKFRSRLEARYAVYMDHLGINWVYELEGFKLPSGWYLPDFYLPTFNHRGSFAEVKFKFNDKEIQLCRELCLLTTKDVILFEGMPDTKVYNYFWMEGIELHENCGIPNADEANCENRMFAEPGYEHSDGSISEDHFDCLGENYLNAVIAAKMARFEFLNKTELSK
jgi:hypothetical protein